MARRLLRTIVVSVTCIESWTLIWLAPEREAPPTTAQASHSTRCDSTSAALLHGGSDEETRGPATCSR